ncbi:hypothetical protein C0995_016002 [Termitomyces sp. Mi166|nr:hypothetical protein C0995_016002 [Termitomyces sp. Mi166\
MDGKILGVGKITWPLEEGKEFLVANKEIELDRPLTRSEYLSGRAFGSSSTAPETSPVAVHKHRLKPFVPHKINPTSKSPTPFRPVDPIYVNDNAPKIKVEDTHWTANWRKPQQKKHQTWDGDAYVSLINGKLVMISEDGKLCAFFSCYHTMIGGREVELDSQVEASQLPDIPKISDGGNKSPAKDDIPISLASPEKFADQVSRFVAPASFYGTPVAKKSKGPLHDPDAEDAVVMKAPTKEHIKRFNKKNLPVVPVVLDPILSRRMRPHQCEGVKFMYESVMGLRKHEGQGCILADEMTKSAN